MESDSDIWSEGGDNDSLNDSPPFSPPPSPIHAHGSATSGGNGKGGVGFLSDQELHTYLRDNDIDILPQASQEEKKEEERGGDNAYDYESEYKDDGAAGIPFHARDVYDSSTLNTNTTMKNEKTTKKEDLLSEMPNEIFPDKNFDDTKFSGDEEKKDNAFSWD